MRERSGTLNLHEVGSETGRAGDPPQGASLWALCCGPRTQERTHSMIGFFFFFKPSLNFSSFTLLFICSDVFCAFLRIPRGWMMNG